MYLGQNVHTAVEIYASVLINFDLCIYAISFDVGISKGYNEAYYFKCPQKQRHAMAMYILTLHDLKLPQSLPTI